MPTQVGWGQFPGVRVLLLGTGQHRPVAVSGLPNVPAVSGTVAALKRTLIDRCGIPAGSITDRLDLPTIEAVGEVVADVARSATDLLIVYYVGHGILSPDGALHLATTGSRALDGRAGHTALQFSTVAAEIADSPAPQRVTILDCCFSGQAIDAIRAPGAGNDLAGQALSPGGFVLTSAGPFQPSLAPVGSRHTAFTGALIRLLRDGDPRAPAELTLDDLHAGLTRAMRLLGYPEPRCRADGAAGQLVVAANPAYRPLTQRRRPPTRPPAVAPTICPYLGLAAFDVSDERWFHGRSRLTGRLVRLLVERWRGPAGPVVVIGGSGAGKSSLLRAGMIPAIGRTLPGVPGSASWPVRIWTPTTAPLTALADQVCSLTGTPANEIVAALRTDPASIVSMLRALQPTDPGPDEAARHRVVLVVDQFEEMFTLHDNDAARAVDRSAFAAALAAAAGGDHGPPVALVVVAMRADWYGRCADDRDLSYLLCDPPLVVAAMNLDEIREAIELPAHGAGLTFEDRLVDLLLHDLGADPATGTGPAEGRLPLLSHALRATWQNRDSDMLTLAGYQGTGGITRALAATADNVMAEITRRFEADGQSVAEQILLRLVHVTRDSDPARLRITRQQALAGLPEPVAPQILDLLSGDTARLVTTDRPPGDSPGQPSDRDSVTFAHEALLREWPLLRALVDTQRSALLIEGDLRVAADWWSRRGHRNADLLTGDELANARRLTSGSQHRFGPGIEEFLDASVGHDRIRRRRQAVSVAALAVIVVLALIGGSAALWQWRSATAASRVALSRQLAAQADAQFAINPDLASLLAIQAFQVQHTAEAKRSLATARNRPLLRTLAGRGHVGAVVSPDGTRAVIADDDSVRVWDVATGVPIALLPGRFILRSINRDGTRLVTTDEGGSGRLWDTETQTLLAALGDLNDEVVFSPDGTALATSAADDNAVSIWNARTGTLTAASPAHPDDTPLPMAFSPDGSRLVVGFEATELWDARAGTVLRTITDDVDIANREQIFSPDSTRLVTAAEGAIRLWDARSANPLASFASDPDSQTPTAEFSPDSTRLVLFGDGDTTRLVDARTGSTVAALPADAGNVEFTHDSARLATAGGQVDLWDGHTGAPIATAEKAEPRHSDGAIEGFSSLAFTPDGSRLVTTDGNATTRLWDGNSAKEIVALPRRTGDSRYSRARFSPDGQVLATADLGDATVRLWSATTGLPLVSLAGHTVQVTHLSFSPDSARLATVGIDQSVRLWDARVGVPLLNLGSLPYRRTLPTFSTDDSRLIMAGGVETRIWDTRSGHTVAKLTDNQSSLTFSGDGAFAAGASGDGTVRIWDGRTGADVASLAGHAGDATSVEFSPDGTHLATAGSGDRTVRIWDSATGTLICTLPDGHGDGTMTLIWSPDGSRLLTRFEAGATTGNEDEAENEAGSESADESEPQDEAESGATDMPAEEDGSETSETTETTVQLWDTTNGGRLSGPITYRGTAVAVFGAPDRLLTASGSDKAFSLWDTRTGRLIARSVAHASGVSLVDFDPTGTRFVTIASEDGDVRLWDGRTGREVARLAGDNNGWGLTFSPDGTRLATVGMGIAKTARLWDSRTGRPVADLADGGGRLTFSPDGTRIASAGTFDGTVQLWDGRTGQPIVSTTDHAGIVAGLTFSADSNRLVIAWISGDMSSSAAWRRLRRERGPPVGRPYRHPDRRTDDRSGRGNSRRLQP